MTTAKSMASLYGEEMRRGINARINARGRLVDTMHHPGSRLILALGTIASRYFFVLLTISHIDLSLFFPAAVGVLSAGDDLIHGIPLRVLFVCSKTGYLMRDRERKLVLQYAMRRAATINDQNMVQSALKRLTRSILNHQSLEEEGKMGKENQRYRVSSYPVSDFFFFFFEYWSDCAQIVCSDCVLRLCVQTACSDCVFRLLLTRQNYILFL